MKRCAICGRTGGSGFTWNAGRGGWICRKRRDCDARAVTAYRRIHGHYPGEVVR